MNKEQLDKLRSSLIEACDRHLANGGIISPVTFCAGNKCCPIGCVTGLVSEYNNRYSDMFNLKLGLHLSEDEFWSFISGFDTHPTLYDKSSMNELYQLGQELRLKYIEDSKW